MATLCSLFQQPGTALLIGLLVVLDPWIWNLAAVVLELLPPFPSHLQPTAWSASAHRTHKHALATCESAYASQSSTSSRPQWTSVVVTIAVPSRPSRPPCWPLCHPKKSLRVSLLLAGPRSASTP